MTVRVAGIALAVLLLAVPACQFGDTEDPVGPQKPTRQCLDIGSPERWAAFIFPVPGQALTLGGDVLLFWRENEACGETYAVVEANYINGSRSRAPEREQIAWPCTAAGCVLSPNHAHAVLPDHTFDEVRYYLTVYDDLGQLGETAEVHVGALPRPQPGPRIPHERTVF